MSPESKNFVIIAPVLRFRRHFGLVQQNIQSGVKLHDLKVKPYREPSRRIKKFNRMSVSYSGVFLKFFETTVWREMMRALRAEATWNASGETALAKTKSMSLE